jgi:hypothetical protein
VLISEQVNIWPEIKAGGAGVVNTDTQEGIRVLLRQWIGMSALDKQALSVRARELYRQQYTVERVAINTVLALGDTKVII